MMKAQNVTARCEDGPFIENTSKDYTTKNYC